MTDGDWLIGGDLIGTWWQNRNPGHRRFVRKSAEVDVPILYQVEGYAPRPARDGTRALLMRNVHRPSKQPMRISERALRYMFERVEYDRG